MPKIWIDCVKVVVVLFVLSGIALAQTQDTCPVIVQAALDLTDEKCSEVGRNQACYGSVYLEATPQAGITEFKFDTPGDVEAVNTIDRLRLTSQVIEEGEWAVVLMRLQAILPNTLPGQNVTFLLFGDVQFQNRVENNPSSVTFPVTVRGSAGLYSNPASGEPFAQLSDGETVLAVGRNATNTWLRVSLDDSSPGWLATLNIESDAKVETLQLLGSTGLPFTPMQAFYFQSGIGNAPCIEAPDSGILVQTPQGVQQVQFNVNGVDITMGSTLYFQAQPHGEMIVSVIEGDAIVALEGVSVNVPAGSQVRIPLDEQGNAFGAPSEPEPYDAERMAVLPTLILPRTVTTAAPISAESRTAELEARAAANGVNLITIGSQPDWVDSGISLSQGQTFTVEAHGRMNPCLDTYPNGAAYCIFFAPQGSPFVVTQNNEFGVFPALGHRFMALVGRIGDGDPFHIGAGGSFTAEQAGTLWLTPNDNTRTDNRGTFSVLIWLDSDE